MSRWVRQIHRWVSVLFTLLVVLNFAVMAADNPPEWVAYLPLPPLFLLLFTGIYLFVLPYFAKRRGAARLDGQPPSS